MPPKKIFLFLFFLSLVQVLPLQLARADALSRNELVIGKVSNCPCKDFCGLSSLGDFLVPRLSAAGITKSRVVLTRTKEEMAELIAQGEVDLVTESSFGALYFSAKAGAEFLLREWRGGNPAYHSVIFVRKDSGISTLYDLKNKIIAFEDPGSTSAYFLPKRALERTQLPLSEVIASGPPPKPDHVGYCFARSEGNILIWVHRNKAQAGALSNEDWDDEALFPDNIREDLAIIHRSEPMPRAMLMVRKDLPADIAESIIRALTAHPLKKPARISLDQYRKGVRYDLLPEADRQKLLKIADSLP